MSWVQKNKLTILHLLLIDCIFLLSLGIMTKKIVFGSEAGRWVYPYIHNISLQPFVLFASFFPLAIVAYVLSQKYIRKYEYFIVLCVSFLGFFLQATIFTAIRGPQYIVNYSAGIGSSPYYVVSRQYTPIALLSEYHTISISTIGHIRANMPGKVLLYQFLELLTEDRLTLAYLVILISDLSGLLVYALAKNIFENRNAALTAVFLYLLLPSKLFVSPLLNTISPVFLLFSFLFLLKFLSSKRKVWAILWGISFYLMALFDPLVITATPIQFFFIVRSLLNKTITLSDMVGFLITGAFAFISMHVFFTVILHFNAISQLIFIQFDTRQFNRINNRRYPIWIKQNLVDLFLNAGLPAFLMFAAFQIRLLLKMWQNPLSFLFQPAHLLFFAFTFTILAINFSGIIRGEVVRLWIFFAVFIAMLAADVIHEIGNTKTSFIVLGGILLQSIITLSMVKF